MTLQPHLPKLHLGASLALFVLWLERLHLHPLHSAQPLPFLPCRGILFMQGTVATRRNRYGVDIDQYLGADAGTFSSVVKTPQPTSSFKQRPQRRTLISENGSIFRGALVSMVSTSSPRAFSFISIRTVCSPSPATVEVRQTAKKWTSKALLNPRWTLKGTSCCLSFPPPENMN